MDEAKSIDLSIITRHPENAVKFFKIIMRFEYALKRCGYVNKRLFILWKRYAKEKLGEGFFDHIKNKGVAPKLIAEPPKKQIKNGDGVLGFDPCPACKNTKDLIDAVCRTRNNLFHGGKSGDVDGDRNDALIHDAINVLIEVLEHDSDLRDIFEGKSQ